MAGLEAKPRYESASLRTASLRWTHADDLLEMLRLSSMLLPPLRTPIDRSRKNSSLCQEAI